MNEAECRTAFAAYIAEAASEGFGEAIKVNPDQYVPTATFLKLFGSCPLVFDALIEADGGVMGYRAFFERAKADGMLQ